MSYYSHDEKGDAVFSVFFLLLSITSLAFIFMKVANWFVTSQFAGIPAISFRVSLGVVMLFTLLGIGGAKIKPSDSFDVSASLLHKLAAFWLLFIFAWIFQLFV